MLLGCSEAKESDDFVPDRVEIVQDAAAPEAPDAGEPSGCKVRTAGPKPATTVESRARESGAAVAWQVIEEALHLDGKSATATLSPGEVSEELRLHGFGFNIPRTATIVGIGAVLTRRASARAVLDDQITVLLGDRRSPLVKRAADPWPVSGAGTHTYGDKSTTWDFDAITPADVNAATFTVSVTAKHSGDAAAGVPVASVDAIQVTIHYCE